MIDLVTLRIVANSAGAGISSGNTLTTQLVTGKVLAVCVDFGGAPATTDLTLTAEAQGGMLVQTLLALTNVNSNGWYYPRASTIKGSDGSVLLYAAGGSPVADLLAVYGPLKCAVAQVDSANVITATVLLER